MAESLREETSDSRCAGQCKSDCLLPVVGAGIDVEEPIYYGLRTELDPGVVAIQHKHKVVVVSLVETVEILRCAVDLGQMRTTFDKRRIIECLLPVDDLWARVA